MAKVVKIIVDYRCTGCETCVNNCPSGVYEIRDGKSLPARVEDCILCRTCESQCPEGAIQIIETETEPARAEPPKTESTKKKTKKKSSPKPAKSRKKPSH